MNNREVIELIKSVARGEMAAADATWRLKNEKIGIVYSAYIEDYDNKRELIFARGGWKSGKETVLPCHFSTLLYEKMASLLRQTRHGIGLCRACRKSL